MSAAAIAVARIALFEPIRGQTLDLSVTHIPPPPPPTVVQGLEERKWTLHGHIILRLLYKMNDLLVMSSY